jgi:hypothetical protein
MFDHLIVSLEKMEDKDSLTEHDVKFQGFDSHTEDKRWSYALHLVEDQQKSKTKAEDLKGYVPMLPKYRAMLALYEPVKTSRIGPEPWLSAHDISFPRFLPATPAACRLLRQFQGRTNPEPIPGLLILGDSPGVTHLRNRSRRTA